MSMKDELYVDWGNVPSARIAEVFDTYGAVVIKGLLENELLESFRSSLLRVMSCRLQTLGQTVRENTDLDSLYNQLCAIDPKHGKEIIIAARDLPDFYRVIGSPALNLAISNILPDTLFQVVHDICLFRIDPPSDHSRNFDWHSDFPYNVCSLSAVTAWAPLLPIERDMGCLKIVPASHKKIHPVNFGHDNAGGGKFSGHKVYSLYGVDENILDNKSIEVVDVNPGDVLLLHSCLLHCSGINLSQSKSRWVVNLRFGDLLDPQVIERDWVVVRDKNPYIFGDFYPSLVH